MTFDKPVTIQVQNPKTERWTDALKLHANVNKTSASNGFNAGADQYHPSLTFKFRYTNRLESIAYGPQPYRIVYRGHNFKVTDYDDYMEEHRTIKLVGVLYG